MGIDSHSLQLLCYAREKFGELGDTVTLGRLAVLLGPKAARKWSGTAGGAWCEPLLKNRFGATHVDSIDNSKYEGATIVADLNHPIPNQYANQYDTVLDFGCTEHILDVAQSLRNVSALCRKGGRILHCVPSNGACGHGFYQFSPELFWSWYSPANGYEETEVFLADLCDTKYWYRVPPPSGGKRINVRSSNDVYALVLARKSGETTQTAQQSDYAYTWSQSTDEATAPKPGRLAALREALYRARVTARFADALDNRLAPNGAHYVQQHPALTRMRIR